MSISIGGFNKVSGWSAMFYCQILNKLFCWYACFVILAIMQLFFPLLFEFQACAFKHSSPSAVLNISYSQCHQIITCVSDLVENIALLIQAVGSLTKGLNCNHSKHKCSLNNTSCWLCFFSFLCSTSCYFIS